MTPLNRLCYTYFFAGLFAGLMIAAVAAGYPWIGIGLGALAALACSEVIRLHPKPKT